MLHIMPMLKCPAGASDGGYAISDFKDIDERYGTLAGLQDLSEAGPHIDGGRQLVEGRHALAAR